jgi:hypothetical protein
MEVVLSWIFGVGWTTARVFSGHDSGPTVEDSRAPKSCLVAMIVTGGG